MEKSNKYFYGLIAGLFIVFFAIFILLIFKPKSQYSFAITTKETLVQMTSSIKDFISPIQLAKHIISKDSTIQIIDIRNQFDYINGHLPNAINIYTADILEKKNYNYFRKLQKQNKKIIFYGNDVVEANLPYMILKQVGINNAIVLNGNYSDFENLKIEKIAELGEINLGIDKPAFDFFSLIKKKNEKEQERKKKEKLKKSKYPKKKKSVIVKKQKIDIPKPQEEDEEDEGC